MTSIIVVEKMAKLWVIQHNSIFGTTIGASLSVHDNNAPGCAYYRSCDIEAEPSAQLAY